jgi:hypothetical protein
MPNFALRRLIEFRLSASPRVLRAVTGGAGGMAPFFLFSLDQPLSFAKRVQLAEQASVGTARERLPNAFEIRIESFDTNGIRHDAAARPFTSAQAASLRCRL